MAAPGTEPHPGIAQEMDKLGCRTIRNRCLDLVSSEPHSATDYLARPPPVTGPESLAHVERATAFGPTESIPCLTEGDAKPQWQQAKANALEGPQGAKGGGPIHVQGTAIMPKHRGAAVEPVTGRAAQHRPGRESQHVPQRAVASVAAKGVADADEKSSESLWRGARRQRDRADFLGTSLGKGGKSRETSWGKGPAEGYGEYSGMGTNRWGDEIPGASRPGSKRKARSSGRGWLHGAYPGEKR